MSVIQLVGQRARFVVASIMTGERGLDRKKWLAGSNRTWFGK